MPRGDQMGRQWKIIQHLITAHGGKTVSELIDALELECHSRTVYRDLEALQNAGFPIYTDTVGGRNLWMLMESAREKMPIPMTLPELMALYLARNMLKAVNHTAYYESLKSLFHKIKTSLPSDLVSYLDTMEKTIHIGQRPYKRGGESRDTFTVINDALNKRRYVEIRYHTMSRNRTDTRVIAPYSIWFYDGSFYVIAFCTLRNAIRLFALDRISHMAIQEGTFTVPEDYNPEDFMKSSFGVFKGRVQTVRILFSKEAAGYIREKTWHETQVLTGREDGSLLFEAQVEGTDEIRFWIMSWGSHARVLEPASLKREIREEAEKMLSAHT